MMKNLRKKLTSVCIIMICLYIYFYQKSSIIKSETTTHAKLVKNSNKTDKIVQQEIDTNNISKKLVGRFEYEKIGVNDEGAAIIEANDPKKMLSINHYTNPEERKRLEEAVEIRKRSPTLDFAEDDAKDLYEIEKRIHTGKPDEKTLSFTPSEIPLSWAQYHYVGYVEDSNKDVYPKDHKLPMVRRVYQRSDGNLLIIDEETLKNGGAEIATKEFVTHKLYDYPVHLYSLLSEQTNKQAVYLKVATERSNYIMYVIGDNMQYEESRKVLLDLADNIIVKNT